MSLFIQMAVELPISYGSGRLRPKNRVTNWLVTLLNGPGINATRRMRCQLAPSRQCQ